VVCGGGRRWTTRARRAGRVRSKSFGDVVLGWLPVRRRAGFCTVWQVAVAYFIRRLPGEKK